MTAGELRALIGTHREGSHVLLVVVPVDTTEERQTSRVKVRVTEETCDISYSVVAQPVVVEALGEQGVQ